VSVCKFVKKRIFSLVFCSLIRNFAPQMSVLESLKIDLLSVTSAGEQLDVNIDDSFFEALDGSEVKRGSLHVSLSIRKMSGFYELTANADGSVYVQCDRCLDDMLQPIEAEGCWTVKLGSEYNSDDEQIVVDENEGVLDASWLVYEMIALAIPIKHVHETGKCNAAMTKKLEELSAARSSDVEKEVDPRWAALKNLREQ